MNRDLGRWAGFLVALTIVGGGLSAARTAHSAEGSARLEVYGFGHLDYIQDFKRVNPDWAATLRPSRIPTTEGQFGTDGQAILSARQSRLGVQGTLPTDHGPVFTKFEFDLYGVGADAGQTTIRFRHGYGEWNGWLGGQTNTLFMDASIFLNVIDYWGPCGMAFVRNPQLRYTKTMNENKSFAIAIEHPSGDVDAGRIPIDPDFPPLLGAITADNKVPDLTAAFRMNTKRGHLQIAGIGRRLGFETVGAPNSSPKGHKTAGGVDITATLKVAEKDQIALGGVFGTGLATYMNDGGMDLAPDGTVANPEAKAVPLQGFLVYMDHYWNPKLSSTFGWSRTQVTNTTLQTPDAFQSGDYASVNFVCYPTKNVFFGVEGLWGRRTDNNDNSGEDTRIQVSAHYSFSSLDFGS
jgi:hypothetical protein